MRCKSAVAETRVELRHSWSQRVRSSPTDARERGSCRSFLPPSSFPVSHCRSCAKERTGDHNTPKQRTAYRVPGVILRGASVTEGGADPELIDPMQRRPRGRVD